MYASIDRSLRKFEKQTYFSTRTSSFQVFPSKPYFLDHIKNYRATKSMASTSTDGPSFPSATNKPRVTDPKTTDEIHIHYLLLALNESLKCQPSSTAYSVGCVLTVPSASLHSLLPPVLANAFPWTWTTQNVNHTSTDRRVLSTGHSRELEGNTHAEMNAIDKAVGLIASLSASKATIPQQPQPHPQPGGYGDGGSSGGYGYGSGYGYAGTGQTQEESDNTTTEEPQVIDIDLYTTLEPCSTRISSLKSCAHAILDLNAVSSSSAADQNLRLHISRIFIGAAEPPDFVVCEGARMLSEAGVEVVWVGERKVRLSECDLVELVQPGRDPSEEVDLASVCLRAARRGNE